MTHLSDLETSDSTRNPTIPDQHRTQSKVQSHSHPERVTANYRQLHQVEHDRVNLELLQGVSGYENTKAQGTNPPVSSDTTASDDSPHTSKDTHAPNNPYNSTDDTHHGAR